MAEEIPDQRVYFSDDEMRMLSNQSLAGDKAREVKASKEWAWLQEVIFGALFEEAVQTLRNAKTDEQRLKAQQMFLACEKPKSQLDFLINQGDAARASLEEINATLVNSKEEQSNA